MKRLLIALILVVGGASVLLFYYWQRATQLPDWYREQSSEVQQPAANIGSSSVATNSVPTGSAKPDVATSEQSGSTTASSSQRSRQTLATKIAQQAQQSPDRKSVKVELDQQEINDLFTSELTRKAQEKGLDKAVKGVNTTVQDGTVSSGAVVNLGELSVDQLPADQQRAIAKLVNTFPQLSQRKVYIGLEGRPTVKNGQVQLDDSTRIKLGDLSLTPAELADRLGVSEEQVRQQIELQLQVSGMTVNDVQWQGDRAVVSGSIE